MYSRTIYNPLSLNYVSRVTLMSCNIFNKNSTLSHTFYVVSNFITKNFSFGSDIIDNVRTVCQIKI